MAVNIADISSPLGTKLITITGANGTAQNNIMAGSTTVNMVEINNEADTNNTNYVKFLNGNGSGNANVVTVGTDAPSMILTAPAGKTRTYVFPEGVPFTKLNVWCVNSPGTAGDSGPAGTVTVEILVS